MNTLSTRRRDFEDWEETPSRLRRKDIRKDKFRKEKLDGYVQTRKKYPTQKSPQKVTPDAVESELQKGL